MNSPTTIRLEQDEQAVIHRLASAHGISQSSVIKLALGLGLAELEDLLGTVATVRRQERASDRMRDQRPDIEPGLASRGDQDQ